MNQYEELIHSLITDLDDYCVVAGTFHESTSHNVGKFGFPSNKLSYTVKR